MTPITKHRTAAKAAQGALLLAGTALFGLSPAGAAEGGVLLHGNYCGPGNNAPLPPIDALDAACARHDACTPRGGLASRACNARLQHEADLIAHDPRQPEDLRALAGLVAVGAGILPSDPGPSAATTIGSAARNATAYQPAPNPALSASRNADDLDDAGDPGDADE